MIINPFLVSTVAPPVNSVLPAISGTANPGQTLTGTNGTWSGSPSYAYQWKREGVAIPGETATTYVVRNNDVALDITFTVTATNVGGSTQATSSATQIVFASYETEYTAIQTNATTNGYTAPTTREKQFENRFVKFLKTVSIWSNLDWFGNFWGGGDSGYRLINWRSPGTNNGSLVNAPSFVNNSGFTGNGTSSYINTNLQPSTELSVASQNNISAGVYITAGGQSNGQDIGVITTTRRLAICARNTSDQVYFNLNDNTAVTVSSHTQAVGLYHAYRAASSTMSLRRNNIILSNLGSSTSTGLATSNVYVGARDNAGVADLFSDRTIGLAWLGSSMNIYTDQIKSSFKTYREAHTVSQARGSFGAILNDSFARNSLHSETADYVGTTAGYTVDGVKMTVTGGSAGFLDRLAYQLANSFEEYTQVLSGTLAIAPSGSTDGIGVGISDSSSPDNERSVTCQLNFESGANLGKIIIWSWDGTTATQRAISGSGLPFANGDTYQITFDCSIVAGYRVYTATAVRNGGSSVQAQWTTASAAEGSSTGHFSIFNFGGTMTVTNWSITVDDIKHVKDLFIGDSITHGHGATDMTTRWVEQVSTDRFVSAGNGDVTQRALDKLQNYLDINPHRAFMMIGGNDVSLAVSSGTYQANYTAIRNALVGHGIEVIHLLATPRSVSMVPLNSWITSTFTSDQVIDTYTPLLGSGTSLNASYDSGDGTHLNQAGNNLVASTINAAL